MTLGSRIREYRLKRGLTQSQLADKLHMTEANISSYERNKSVPPLDKLNLLSSVLSVSVDYLLGNTKDPQPGTRAYVFDFDTGENVLLSEKETAELFAAEERVREIRLYREQINKIEDDNSIDSVDKSKLTYPLTKRIHEIENELNVIRENKKPYTTATPPDNDEKSDHLQPLSAKEERDISKKLQAIMDDLDSDVALSFHGEPVEEEDRELLRISLENTLRLSRQLAKQKFTPKKYRK